MSDILEELRWHEQHIGEENISMRFGAAADEIERLQKFERIVGQLVKYHAIKPQAETLIIEAEEALEQSSFDSKPRPRQ